ncbi:MAG TPA: L,D-transpeptidase [Verrucomicrobiae bacterium]|nr:L,D-transpeptidase [Verrucomicrobiae bacterium]
MDGGNGSARQQTAGFVVVLLGVLAISSAAQTLPESRQRTSNERVQRIALVSIPDRELAVLESGTVIARFQVAVGAASTPSPTGEFQIINRVSSPTYYHHGKVIPTGKENPLGTRWLGLSLKGYGIHGTNVPRSVGHAASHGCIRLRNRDAERLFTMLRVGDEVSIHGERDNEITQVFGGADSTTLAAAANSQVGTGQ